MIRNETELSYRRSAIAGASPIGLVIALYDTLSGDLRRAATAIRNNDIQKRCAELNHASLVLGQLESWLDKDSGEQLTQNLATFYAYLRSKMMEASVKQSAATLEEQIELISQVRSAWQQRDAAAPSTSFAPMTAFSADMSGAQERTAFSQSA